ncbi:hypothetical protein I4U23_017389 [Adineta vaga]|nr:hypothetical protein I4U23_017389 [Adineta vaga]
MLTTFLSIVIYLFFLYYTIEKWKIICRPSVNDTNDKSSNNIQYIPLDNSHDELIDDLSDSIDIHNNDQQITSWYDSHLDKSSDQEVSDLTHDTSKEDAYVPKSLDLEDSIYDDFEPISSLHQNNDEEFDYFSLEKVSSNQLPPGIIKKNYSYSDQIKLIQLYQSHHIHDTKQLFQYLAQQIHHRLTNCVFNFGKWLTNPQLDEPIFYRNCVPCTNAVDLNLQSLFDHINQNKKLEHYFVNTCDKQNQWISYISDMKYLSNNLKNISSLYFTDIIRKDLLPNQRYVFQGIVRSNHGNNQKGFFHVCNLINDENDHTWIIDGQIERVFYLNNTDDVNKLNQRYRPDYIARAQTGSFRPSTIVKSQESFQHQLESEDDSIDISRLLRRTCSLFCPQFYDNQIRYFTVGGYALIFHRFVRNTMDIDIVVHEDDFQKATEIIIAAGFDKVLGDGLCARFNHKYYLSVDILTAPTYGPIPNEQNRINDRGIFFCDFPILVLTKLNAYAGRPNTNKMLYKKSQDRTDLIYLIENNDLDEDYAKNNQFGSFAECVYEKLHRDMYNEVKPSNSKKKQKCLCQ